MIACSFPCEKQLLSAFFFYSAYKHDSATFCWFSSSICFGGRRVLSTPSCDQWEQATQVSQLSTQISKKMAFFAGLENNCQKEDFRQKTRAFIVLAPLRNDLILRFEVSGVCPEDFTMRKKCRKTFMSLVIDLNRYF